MIKKTIFAACAMCLYVATAWGQSGNIHFDRGLSLYEAGKWAAAQTEFVKGRAATGLDNGLEREKSDYYIAVCSSKLTEGRATELLDAFLESYPNSIYLNDVQFARGILYYSVGNWSRASDMLTLVNPLDLSGDSREEYYFKTGAALFYQGEYERADNYFRSVPTNSPYGVHTQYYNAYIEYVTENYVAAKASFYKLQQVEGYAQIAPYYILQIEFLEGNYNYVVQNGNALMNSATIERRAEIARIISESQFHLEYFSKAISYMDLYVQNGGVVGRQESYIVGYSYYVLGDYPKAISEFTKVYGQNDELSQNVAYHMADCYVKMGDMPRAMQSFSLAWSMDYNDVIKEDALFNYGKLQYELGGGTFNEAINILTRYVATYPKSPRVEKAREYLASAYYNSNNYSAAYTAIKQIAYPDNNMLAALQKISYFRGLEQFNAGNLNEALVLLNESLAARANSKYTALASFWKGEILYKKGDYKAAIPLYKDFMLLSPTNEKEHVMANYNLGYCYFNIEQWGDAAKNFDTFLNRYKTKDHYRADALNRLGDVAYGERSFAKAIENYDQAIDMGTNERFYSQFQRAVVDGIMGKTDSKVGRLNSIIDKEQGTYVSEATYELGRTYMGLQRYADASRVLKGFVDKYPQSPSHLNALSDLGLISQNLGNNDEAMKYYKLVVSKAPNSPLAKDAMVGIRGEYVEAGDMESYFAYAKSVGVETDLGVVQRDSLSFAAAERQYITATDKSKAEAALRSYVKNYPTGIYIANAHYYIAEVRLAAEDKKGAIESYAKVANLYSNDFTIRALDKLSKLSFDEKQYAQSADGYQKLSHVVVNPSTVNEAMGGYIKSVVALGDNNNIIAAADDLLARSGVDADVTREARFAKAVALEQIGSAQKANDIYKVLATESKTIQGATSTYKVIEEYYRKGEMGKAKEMVVAMGRQNTPHSYWLGKSFLILGDIYAFEKDTFQARATYQSIVDGYTPSNDGVVDAAKERIKKMK